MFEAHTQQKCPFTAYLQGFVNAQSARNLKTGFLFSFKMSLISFPIKDGKPNKKRGQKSLAKSDLECWQNCLWLSIVFHCSFFGFSLALVLIVFSLFFP